MISNEIYPKIQENFERIYFEKFIVVAILASEDEYFRSGTCKIMEKLSTNYWYNFKPISYLVGSSLQMNLIMFVHFGR